MTILAALRFGGWLDVTNISPISGVGSQLLTLNVWANPSYWPFAVLDKELATDVSAVVALGIFATACYIMARCFDVPIVPSVVAAQTCVALFAPLVLFLGLSTVFCLTVGNAVVYAPFMPALGLLVRLEPGSIRNFATYTIGIMALIFYAIYCDPLWAMVSGLGWVVPFAVVTLGAFRLKTIFVRSAALCCCFVFLLISGAAAYLYTLSRYTARVQFADTLDRPRGADFTASALFYSPYMKYFYLSCILGWFLGFLILRDRPRIFVAAAIVSAGALLAYGIVYLLLLNRTWTVPLPVYMEQALFPLFTTAAVAGYWATLQLAGQMGRSAARAFSRWVRPQPSLISELNVTQAAKRGQVNVRRPRLQYAAMAAAIPIFAAIPVATANLALTTGKRYADYYYYKWTDEPELIRFLNSTVGQSVDQRFRGSIHFWGYHEDTQYTIMSAWAAGIATVEEYSQLVTAQSLYFIRQLFQQNILGALNSFVPMVFLSYDTFWKTLQLFGVRYFVVDNLRSSFADINKTGFSLTEVPRRPIAQMVLAGQKPGSWFLYELPHPNLGDYSPTEVLSAQSGVEIMAKLAAPDFDYRKQVVLTETIQEALVPVRDVKLTRIRGGWHVSGASEGTSLIVLPQQFSHCLRMPNGSARFVRANLMLAAVVFSGSIDNDVVFGYGLTYCRFDDLADVTKLGLQIDLRMAHLMGDRIFPNWLETKIRLSAAAKQIR